MCFEEKYSKKEERETAQGTGYRTQGKNNNRKPTRIFHENALASATPSPQERTWVSEQTTIKWSKHLTFRRFPAAGCRELQLLSRDHETGNSLVADAACGAGLSGAQRARIRWACHLATAGCWVRGVPERYGAGADTRGRQEGRQYPWSQQVIHEISGLRTLP